MTKLQKYNGVKNAFMTMEKNGKDIYIYNEKIAEEVKEALREIQGELGADFELSYEIMADACGVIGEGDFEDLNDETDAEIECASIYIADRLAYLSPKNEYDITETMKEHNTDIQTACAIWYDNMVRNAYYQIKDYILLDNKN